MKQIPLFETSVVYYIVVNLLGFPKVSISISYFNPSPDTCIPLLQGIREAYLIHLSFFQPQLPAL